MLKVLGWSADECTMSQANQTKPVLLVVAPAPEGRWQAIVLTQRGMLLETSAPRFETPEKASFWAKAVYQNELGREVIELSDSEAQEYLSL